MIDLHIHTTATPHHSSWDPGDLVRHAAANGYQAIACSDHNTLASVAALQAAGAVYGLRVIPGVEVDSGFGGKLWHTLVYGVAPESAALQALCAAVLERNLADAARLQTELAAAGFALDGLDALGRPANVADVGTALARDNPLPGRVAGEDDEAAGMRYLLTELPNGYRPVGVDEVIAVARAAGGVAVLAHPGRAKGIYAIPADAADIAALRAAGLDGLEVYYPSHTSEQTTQYAALALKHGLVLTGGSDSHHPHQPLATWPAAAFAPFFGLLAERAR